MPQKFIHYPAANEPGSYPGTVSGTLVQGDNGALTVASPNGTAVSFAAVSEYMTVTPTGATLAFPNSVINFGLEGMPDSTCAPMMMNMALHGRNPVVRDGGTTVMQYEELEAADGGIYIDANNYPTGWPALINGQDSSSYRLTWIQDWTEQLIDTSMDNREGTWIYEATGDTAAPDMDMGLVGSGTVTSNTVTGFTRRIAFTVTGPVTIYINANNVTTANYPRDNRLFKTEHEAALDADPLAFNPLLLAELTARRARGVRFMNALNTNDNEIVKFSDYPPTTAMNFRTIPPAICTKLCGEANVNGLFCIPGRAAYYRSYLDVSDPDYLTPGTIDTDIAHDWAVFLRDNMPVHLEAMVSYSNEVWNYAYAIATALRQLADAAWGVNSLANHYAMFVKISTLMGERMNAVFANEPAGRFQWAHDSGRAQTGMTQEIVNATQLLANEPTFTPMPQTVSDVIMVAMYYASGLSSRWVAATDDWTLTIAQEGAEYGHTDGAGGSIAPTDLNYTEIIDARSNGADQFYIRLDLGSLIPLFDAATTTIEFIDLPGSPSAPLVQAGTGGARFYTADITGIRALLAAAGATTRIRLVYREFEFMEPIFDAIRAGDTQDQLNTVIQAQIVAGGLVQETIDQMNTTHAITSVAGFKLQLYEGGWHGAHLANNGFKDDLRPEYMIPLNNFNHSLENANNYVLLYEHWETIGDGPFMLFNMTGTHTIYGLFAYVDTLGQVSELTTTFDAYLANETPFWLV